MLASLANLPFGGQGDAPIPGILGEYGLLRHYWSREGCDRCKTAGHMGTMKDSKDSPGVPDVTALLHAWTGGESAALDRLTPLIHGELRRLAGRLMSGEQPDHTLQPTALVNEAFLRLVDIKKVKWQDRAHFLAMASRTMRRILVDMARSKSYQKRGSRGKKVLLDEGMIGSDERSRDVVALDDALKELAAIDSRKSEIVELRFFGGLTAEESAEVLKVSVETVLRDWRLARAWLRRELSAMESEA
jgi:RNA polymerase sigma-70 factor, ECF subfamily